MSEPIRILHVIGCFEMGGSQAMVLNLYRVIDRSKVQFDFITDHPERNDLLSEFTELGAKVYTMPSFKGSNYFEIKRKWNVFFKQHPEYKVLHSHVRSYASIYLPIAHRYGVKTIIHSHSTSNGAGVPALVKSVMQYPLRYQADYLFACSEEAGKWLFGKKAIKKKNFKVIPNAIDSKRFEYNIEKRDEIRRQLKVSDRIVIGHVGRFTEPKNHLFLVEIFAEMYKKRRNIILLLVGDGDLQENIKDRVRCLGIQDAVIMVGSKSNTEDYYQAMDIFVFPSLWEGLGIAVVEAQASGLNCVVSDRVPRTVDVNANLVEFLSLDKGANVWSCKVEEALGKNRLSQIKKIENAGFDIEENALYLEKFYLSLEKNTENL